MLPTICCFYRWHRRRHFGRGVEVGLGTELDNGEIYGPVLYKAYELERELPEYPRIVVGRELINYLTQLAQGHKQIPEQAKEDVEVGVLMGKKVPKNDCPGFGQCSDIGLSWE